MDPRLIQLALTLVPSIIERIRSAFQSNHPGDPAPTDAEIIAAYQTAFVSSLAKDDQWLAMHPTVQKPVTGSS